MEVHEGDLLSVDRGIIVHGCNCQGVMGSGIAKAIREKWPVVYDAYESHYYNCDDTLYLGDIVTVASYDCNDDWYPYINNYTTDLPAELIVVNAMTQFDYGRDKNVVYVDYDAITAAFARVKILARETKLPVHFPRIGAGLANGDWDEIRTRIINTLGHDIEKHLWVLP